MFQNRPPSYKNTQYIDLTKTRAVPNIQHSPTDHNGSVDQLTKYITVNASHIVSSYYLTGNVTVRPAPVITLVSSETDNDSTATSSELSKESTD